MEPITTPDKVAGEVLRQTEPFRVQALRFISGLGLILAAIGSLDLTTAAGFLPDHVAPWLVTIGLFAAASKQWLLILGDILDNGKRDNSFKLPAVLLIAGLAVFFTASLSSCGGFALKPRVDAQGCLLAPVTGDNGDVYELGTCPDGSVVAQWKNAEGFELRAAWKKDQKGVDVFYRTAAAPGAPPNPWLPWGSKSGVTLDGAPVEMPEV